MPSLEPPPYGHRLHPSCWCQPRPLAPKALAHPDSRMIGGFLITMTAAEPPDMASVDSPPLAELRAEAQAVRATNIAYAESSPYGDEARRAIDRAVKAHLMVEARMPEVMAGLMVRERLLSAGFTEAELEWIAPAEYGWGELGQEGNQLYGIRIRAVENVDHLYLAVVVKP